jgi:4-amino-4-deoxy-L-arabinose transferase-like glycosyltransferase
MAALYFVDLGGTSIWDANEAFYVETPREMLEAHDLINPTFNYLPRFNKPVLSYWIVAGFYRLFGVSVAAQRVPIAIGALVLIACAWLLAQAAGSRAAGLWAALGLAVDPRLVMFARRIFIDIWISAFMVLTLTCFALAERYPARRRTFLVLMYVSVGLGVLTKGPVAVALPGLAFAIYLAAHRELGRIREMLIPLGVVIVAVIVVPWYAALYHQHGWAQIRSFLITENLERYTAGEGVRQARGAFFYLPVVFSDAFPWSMLLVAAALSWFRRRGRIESLLWCWIVAIVGFFSFSAGKQDLYIFPIVPAVAALGGLVLARAVDDAREARAAGVTLVVTGALLALAGAAVLYVFATAGRVYALQGAVLVGALGVAGGLACAMLAALRRHQSAAAALVVALIAVNWIFVLRVLPGFERYKPVVPMSETIAGRLRPGDAVAQYQVALPSMVYYLRRHVDQYFDPRPFVDAVRSERRLFAVISDDDYAALAGEIGARTCVVARHPTFNVKLGSVLARQPLPELLLITNDCR